jgi:hypothetical protein
MTEPLNPHAHTLPDDDSRRQLAESDAGVARITEDLIDILITRGLIQFTDFPPAAQAKLLERRQTRSVLSNRLRLLDEGDSDLI